MHGGKAPIDILYKIQSFFNSVGSIYTRPDRKLAVYRVSNVNELSEVIIPHFNKYTLISQKYVDFLFWSKVVNLVLNKEHLKLPGFLIILNYYASINRGASKKVLSFFPDIKPLDRPLFNLPVELDPFWVSGFVAGDGGGFAPVYIHKPSKINSLRERLTYRFYITQHSKDLDLMKLFIKFFNCGVVHVRSNLATPRCDYIVQDGAPPPY